MAKKIFVSFQDAKKIVFGRVKNREEYRTFVKRHPQYNLPTNPRETYYGEYISFSDFLGTKERTFIRPKKWSHPTFEEAKQIVFGRVKNREEYYEFRAKHPEYNLPMTPRVVYRNEYKGLHDFLGVPKYDPKEYLKQYWADVKAQKRTRRYGYNIKQSISKEFPSYDEAKQILKGRQVSTIREYRKFRVENPQYNLPSHPEKIYVEKWISFPEFLRI